MPIQKFIVSRDDTIYEAWPDVALADDGTLICVFAECESHLIRKRVRLMLTESCDRGRTWTKKHPLTEMCMADWYYNCPRISRLPDGTLAIICDYNEGGESPEQKTSSYVWLSHDCGKTWSAPRLTPLLGIVPDKYHVLKNGRHILSAHFPDKVTGKLAQHLIYSDDHGTTWSSPITVASDPRYRLCEGSILETPDGALVCFLRENSSKGIDCLKTISYDSGESWSELIPVPIPACHRPVAGYLQNGDIMITHRFMQGGRGWLGSWTQNLFAAFMPGEDVLQTERNAHRCRIMPLDFDRSPVSDLGYTGWVQFPDGELYVVNYIVDDAPKAHIRGYSFRQEDVILRSPGTTLFKSN